MRKNKKIIVVGAGLAGAVAARSLCNAGHEVIVYEKSDKPGGLCRDDLGYQMYGPHMFHTNSKKMLAVMAGRQMWHAARLEVACLTASLHGLPAANPIMDEYTRKAWGLKAGDPPPVAVKKRMAKIKPGRYPGYHSGSKFSGIPSCGFTGAISRLFNMPGIRVLFCEYSATSGDADADHIVWTAPADELIFKCVRPLKWMGRKFAFHPGSLPVMQINYSTPLIPQLRCWDSNMICRFAYERRMVGMEFAAPAEESGKFYPVRDPQSIKDHALIEAQAAKLGIILCGRGGKYRYMDMAETMLDTLKTLKKWGLADESYI